MYNKISHYSLTKFDKTLTTQAPT
eukprot:COSAG01_NODE_48190_length_383_cov_1.091549_1_plen_23_part_10